MGRRGGGSEKEITEGATAEWHAHGGVTPHPLETTMTRAADLHGSRLKATAPLGTEMVKQECLKAFLLNLTLKDGGRSAKLWSWGKACGIQCVRIQVGSQGAEVDSPEHGRVGSQHLPLRPSFLLGSLYSVVE